jgi:hypothetical protein
MHDRDRAEDPTDIDNEADAAEVRLRDCNSDR